MTPEIIGEIIFWLVFTIIMIGSVVSVGLATVVAPAQVVAADKVGVQVYHGAAEMLQLTLDVRPP